MVTPRIIRVTIPMSAALSRVTATAMKKVASRDSNSAVGVILLASAKRRAIRKIAGMPRSRSGLIVEP